MTLRAPDVIKFELSERELAGIPIILLIIYESYKCYLAAKTRSVEMTASQYAKGLLPQQGRDNMSNYADNVSGASAGRFQYFISRSPWEYRQISAQTQCDVLVHMGDERNEAIHIDETGFPKQDRDSIGVKWQYRDRLGRVDNCQVAVCLDYTNGSMLTLIDAELCVPEDWANDTYQTKAEIAFELIQGAISMEFNLAGVGMNTFYGMQTSLPNVIDLAGIVYIADILSDSNSVQFEIAPRIQIEEFNE